jgi:hypothetical protein
MNELTIIGLELNAAILRKYVTVNWLYDNVGMENLFYNMSLKLKVVVQTLFYIKLVNK